MTFGTDRLKLVDVERSFGALKALDGVSMSVARGSVHGLLGENGAGKSMLLRILSGVFDPSAGHVEIDGVRVAGHGPGAARSAGIAMIHQEPQHVPELTVAQNMFLGRPIRMAGGLLVDRRACGGRVLRRQSRPRQRGRRDPRLEAAGLSRAADKGGSDRHHRSREDS